MLTTACVTGAGTSAAVCGCPGPACQPHAGTGAVPGAAGLQGANPVSAARSWGKWAWSPAVPAERLLPCRLLWYPEGGHALTGVEMEADVFGNCARWFLQHLERPPVGQHGP